jgi:hypothetical protein
MQLGDIHKSYPINSNVKCKCNFCFKLKVHPFGASENVNKNSSFDITSYSFHLHIIKPEIDLSTGKIIDGYKCQDKNCSYNNVDKVLKDNREKMNQHRRNFNSMIY